MSTTGIITMVAILAFVWGGFALFVIKTVKKEKAKARDAA